MLGLPQIQEKSIEHGNAIRWIAQCLKGTADKETTMRVDANRKFEVMVDADFTGNWDPDYAENGDQQGQDMVM